VFQVLVFVEVSLVDDTWPFIRLIQVPALPPIGGMMHFNDVFETYQVNSVWWKDSAGRYEIFLDEINRPDMVPGHFATEQELADRMIADGWAADDGHLG
jgi:hypothetical protein